MPEKPLEKPLVRLSLELAVRGALALLAGALAGLALVAVDVRYGFWLPLGRAGVEPLLVTLAGAILTIIVFAVWMRAVVVGLVSSRFSPRTTSKYLDDRFQRSITTWMTGGFALLLAVATRVHALPGEGVPALSVLASVGVVVAGVLGLLLAVRHATMSLALPELIRQLADQAIRCLETRDRPDDDIPADGFLPADRVTADELGWVRSLDYDRTVTAIRAGTTVRFEVAVGSFVVPGDPIASGSCEFTEAEAEAVRTSVRLARVRSAETDLAYALQELLDVGEYAANPGNADISTALEVVVHLEAALVRLLEVGLPTGHRRGDDRRRVLGGSTWTVADHVYVVVSRLSKFGSGDPTITRELIQAFERLLGRARALGRDEAAQVLGEELEALRRDVPPNFLRPKVGVRADGRSW